MIAMGIQVLDIYKTTHNLLDNFVFDGRSCLFPGTISEQIQKINENPQILQGFGYYMEQGLQNNMITYTQQERHEVNPHLPKKNYPDQIFNYYPYCPVRFT